MATRAARSTNASTSPHGSHGLVMSREAVPWTAAQIWDPIGTGPRGSGRKILASMHSDRTIIAEAFEDTRKLLEQRITETQRQMKEVEKSVDVKDELDVFQHQLRDAGGDPNFTERYMEVLAELLDPTRGRKMVARLIDYVEILPAKHRGGNVFDPSRVVIHWKRPLPEKVLETVGFSWQVAEEAAKTGENPWDALAVALAGADKEWSEHWLVDAASASNETAANTQELASGCVGEP